MRRTPGAVDEENGREHNVYGDEDGRALLEYRRCRLKLSLILRFDGLSTRSLPHVYICGVPSEVVEPLAAHVLTKALLGSQFPPSQKYRSSVTVPPFLQ